MKIIKLYLLFVFLGISFFSYAYNPLLTVVIMVKNEEHVIEKTLQPFVDAGVDSFLVFDTGSDDDTVAVTQEFFAKNEIENGVIYQEPFVDFATSRNRALRLAEGEFYNGCFMLMLDAEWYMENVKGLLEFCDENQYDFSPSYLVRIIGPNLDFYTARLIRCNSNVSFVGAVHEVVNYPASQKVPADVFFNLKVSRYGKEKTKKRWLRDKDILFAEYEKNPTSCRTVFYLAQTYECLGDWENACKWYKLRMTMNGWSEENFMALYKLAKAYENLGQWDNALHYYLAASQVRPTRAEPLIRLANHYWSVGDESLCFLFAQRAVQLAYPKSDLLFVEKELYDFTRYDLLGRSAWYVQEYEIGKNAVEHALSVRPDLSYLENNLEIYSCKV